MMFSIPDWKCIHHKNFLIVLDVSGASWYQKSFKPEISINRHTEDSSVSFKLEFDSVDELKKFLRKIEETIPFLQQEHRDSYQEHLRLNPELKDKE